MRRYHTEFVGGADHGREFGLFAEAQAFRRTGVHWEHTHREGIALVVTRIGAEVDEPAAMAAIL